MVDNSVKSITFVGISTVKIWIKPRFVHLLVIGENFSSFRAALHKRLWKLLSALFPECGGHMLYGGIYLSLRQCMHGYPHSPSSTAFTT
jgi:hypothetical protein